MKLSAFNTKGNKLDSWEVNAKSLGELNPSLLTQALRVYQVNSHQGTSRVKTRGEVVGSTRKIYRQKGTGNARHGARYAPLFVGGGIAHGPKGVRAGNLVLPKKMRRAALKSALLVKLTQQELAGLQGIAKLDGKTTVVAGLLHKLAGHPANKTLIITRQRIDRLYQAVSNLQGITLKRANLVNAYDLVYADFVLVTKPALHDLLTRAAPKLPKLKNKPST